MKVVYQDGEDVSVQKGDLVSANQDFIVVVSLKTEYVIALKAIIKLEVENEQH